MPGNLLRTLHGTTSRGFHDPMRLPGMGESYQRVQHAAGPGRRRRSRSGRRLVAGRRTPAFGRRFVGDPTRGGRFGSAAADGVGRVAGSVDAVRGVRERKRRGPAVGVLSAGRRIRRRGVRIFGRVSRGIAGVVPAPEKVHLHANAFGAAGITAPFRASEPRSEPVQGSGRQPQEENSRGRRSTRVHRRFGGAVEPGPYRNGEMAPVKRRRNRVLHSATRDGGGRVRPRDRSVRLAPSTFSERVFPLNSRRTLPEEDRHGNPMPASRPFLVRCRPRTAAGTELHRFPRGRRSRSERYRKTLFRYRFGRRALREGGGESSEELRIDHANVGAAKQNCSFRRYPTDLQRSTRKKSLVAVFSAGLLSLRKCGPHFPGVSRSPVPDISLVLG
ncbi:UNVERIFIED_CONTAM: hypothetical protein PYX00_002640 [Menopon gallinae]|uniref:Uncharacterized protein n=1 Tax=Menopon gallinae TaxID=328185 RepID=A0AAW2HXB2_9NEOP